MDKKISTWFDWMKQFILPPHPISRQQLADGEAEISLQQPIYFWVSLGLLILYGFIPQKIVVVAVVTLLGIQVTGYLWAVNILKYLDVNRKLRYAAVQVGDELEETFLIKNQSWLPLIWIGVEDDSDFPGYSIGVVRGVDSYGNAEWRVNQICTQRGVFTLGPWKWVTSDPFGIFSIQRRYTTAQTMIVYPPLALISNQLLPHGKQSGDLRPLNQPLVAESIQATQTRVYQPGDPLRRIHWKTTARKGSLYVKSFDPEAASRIWLVADFDPKVHNHPLSKDDWQDSSEETMILLLSALAGQLLTEQRAVGFYAGVVPDRVVMPQRGLVHLWSILATLAPLHLTQKISFADTLIQAQKLVNTNDLIIAVTPSLDTSWVHNLAKIGRGYPHSEAWVYVLDPESFGLSGNASAVSSLAGSLGITTRIIVKGDVQPQIGGMGALRRWEYLTLGTGRVVVRNRPRQAEELIGLQKEREYG